MQTKSIGLIFDNDGVIVDTEQWLLEANTKVAANYEFTFNPSLRKFFTGKPNIPGLRKLLETHEINHVSAEEFAEKRDPMFKEWYRNCKFTPGFREYFRKIQETFPEARKAIASGTDPEFFDLEDKCLNVKKMFNDNVALSRECVVNHKPAPDIVVYAAGMIRVPTNRCVVWEDSPLGIVSAYRAGVKKIIAYTRTLPKEDLKQSIHLLTEQSIPEKNILYVHEWNEESAKKTIAYIEK